MREEEQGDFLIIIWQIIIRAWNSFFVLLQRRRQPDFTRKTIAKGIKKLNKMPRKQERRTLQGGNWR